MVKRHAIFNFMRRTGNIRFLIFANIVYLIKIGVTMRMLYNAVYMCAFSF